MEILFPIIFVLNDKIVYRLEYLITLSIAITNNECSFLFLKSNKIN